MRRTEASRCGLVAAALLGASVAAGDGNPYLPIAGAEFRSALPVGQQSPQLVRSFLLQQHAVTNAEFLAFVRANPQWRRGAVPVVLAGGDYLAHWAGPLDPGPPGVDLQPVTRVSWFAAEAYCEAQAARLPYWLEWEFVAAAGVRERDARSDPAWRQQILDWYAHPASAPLLPVEQRVANVYGVYDLHGLVWEWVQDFNSLLPSDADPEKFCGGAAQNLQQKENYAILMRIALLGSLQATDTGRAVGFRCARDGENAP
ncbi:MAG: formylglycine-generating enzyme family protein [Proteobacteria bacterium]|nr:formylglycine-generating enzyme family protein [Pseudomonadota bacterium]